MSRLRRRKLMSNIYKKVTAIIVSILVISSSFVWSFDRAYAKEKLNIDAKAGIIYLADTDEILWEKGLDYVCDIASITKLLTTTVALDYVNVNDRVVFEENEISIDDLLHLVLMESNNDAVRLLAEEAVLKAGKDMSWFINLMNEPKVFMFFSDLLKSFNSIHGCSNQLQYPRL